ncbi:adhesion G protein-coupled receptor E5 isoform X2 [Amia ocellicauda]|uniref:adhesion G protein-coupled receptor E5 isoform X2 n=1 Tax=Amia ocellicauda TaxID=2972642 RepID=UPI003463D004
MGYGLLILGLTGILVLPCCSSCPEGFDRLPGGKCNDTDECADGYCPDNSQCFNTIGSYYCQCNSGFRSSTGKHNFSDITSQCRDINECQETPDMCGSNAVCFNGAGNYSCTCNSGYISSNGKEDFKTANESTCEDLDECSQTPTICGSNSSCKNTAGSYKCDCHSGFSKSGNDTEFCRDVNECEQVPSVCGSNAKCTNTLGSYNCTCHLGYNNSGNETGLCTDVDECAQNQQICDGHARCTNTDGGYRCVCEAGFSNSENETGHCQDIDECKNNSLVCGKHSCSNIHGSYKCICNNSTFSSFGRNATPCIELNCDQYKRKSNNDLGNLSDILDHMQEKCLMVLDHSFQDGKEVLKDLLDIIDDFLVTGPMKNNQVSPFLDIIENAMMLIAPLTEGQTRVSGKTLEVDMRVNNESTPQGQIILSSDKVTMGTHWETVADKNSTGFAAVALVSYNNLHRHTNNSFGSVASEMSKGKVSSLQMNSIVATASISNLNRKDLAKPVTFIFSHLKAPPKDGNTTCVYWASSTNGGFWSTQGCKTLKSNATYTECQCSHLSSFAVLLALYDLEDTFQLQVITWVGLSLSLVCLLICIVTFYCCRSIQGTRNTIHLHLCVSLFIADLVFLAGISSTQNRGGCAFVAGLLHYFFLATFCWMCLEGIHLYRMVVLVFNTNLRLAYMLAFGYGIPALIVGISAAVNSQGYGTKKHCWLNLENGFIWSFFGPVCVIIIANAFFFMITVWKLAQKFSSLNPDLSNLKKIRTFTVTAVAQLCILGSMWIFGCFQFERSTIVMSYLFTILNSIQGVLIFIMHCLFYKPVRDEYTKLLPGICLPKKKTKYSEFSSSNQSASSQGLKSSQHTGESQM